MSDGSVGGGGGRRDRSQVTLVKNPLAKQEMWV